jgi:glucokinase
MSDGSAAGRGGVAASWIPALDIGGTHVTAGVVDLGTREVRPPGTRRFPVPSDGSAARIVAAIVDAALTLDAGPGKHWAIAVPGPFDYARGVALYRGVGKFETLYGLDLRAALMTALPEPASVTFVNDAAAFLLGEHWAGAARGHERAVGITLGSGVGSAFLVGRTGIVEHGPYVPPQGRADLLAYAGRPLEDTVSRRAVRAAYAHASGSGGEPLADVREITDRARGADRAAQRVLSDAMNALGQVIAPWLARFEATVLVVGGSVAGSWDLLAGPLGAAITGAEPDLPASFALSPAALPVQAPLLGAALCASRPGTRSSVTL